MDIRARMHSQRRIGKGVDFGTLTAVVAAPTLIGMTEVAFLGTQSGSKALSSTAVWLILPSMKADVDEFDELTQVAVANQSGHTFGIFPIRFGPFSYLFFDFEPVKIQPVPVADPILDDIPQHFHRIVLGAVDG